MILVIGDGYSDGWWSDDCQVITDWQSADFIDIWGTQNQPTDSWTSGDNQATVARLVGQWHFLDRSLEDSRVTTPMFSPLTGTDVPSTPLYKYLAALRPPYFESWDLQDCWVVCNNSTSNTCVRGSERCISSTRCWSSCTIWPVDVRATMRACRPILVWLMFCCVTEKDSLPVIAWWSCYSILVEHWRLLVRCIFNP